MSRRTGHVEIGTHQRRTEQRGEYPALLARFTRDGPAQSRANPRRFRTFFGEPPGQRAYQLAIGIESENFEPGDAARIEALAVVRSARFYEALLMANSKLY